MGFASQTVGLKYTSATKFAFLTGSAVAIIPIVQFILERRKPKVGSVIGVVLVLLGVVFLSGGKSILTLLADIAINFNFGDLLTMICAIFFALYVVYLDILSSSYNFWILLTMQIVVAMTLAFIFAAIIAFIAMHETITPFGLFGAVLIFLGLIISETFDGIHSCPKQLSN